MFTFSLFLSVTVTIFKTLAKQQSRASVEREERLWPWAAASGHGRLITKQCLKWESLPSVPACRLCHAQSNQRQSTDFCLMAFLYHAPWPSAVMSHFLVYLWLVAVKQLSTFIQASNSQTILSKMNCPLRTAAIMSLMAGSRQIITIFIPRQPKQWVGTDSLTNACHGLSWKVKIHECFESEILII